MTHRTPIWLHQRTVEAYGKRVDLKNERGELLKHDYFFPMKQGQRGARLIKVTPAESRRRIRMIEEYLTPAEVLEIIQNAKSWPYKTKHLVKHMDNQIDRLLLRDKALLCLLYLTGGRINKVVALRKRQFNYEADPECILIEQYEISKRKAITIIKKGQPTVDIELPKIGSLASFTSIVEAY